MLVQLIDWLAFFRLIRFEWSGTRRSGCLFMVVLNGTGGIDTWLSIFLPNPNVWITLHWFNYWSSAKWAWIEVLEFINGWLGKVPLGLSLSELASWLIWTSNLDLTWLLLLNSCLVFCMKEAIIFSKSVNFFQLEDFRMKIVQLG